VGFSSDPQARSRASRVAALTRHAFGDSVEATAPARAGFLAKFEVEVDPDGQLAPDERARRAKRALRAHMLTLATASARARAKGASR
jgi:hypothetical protein